jgi:hypothetical protein
MRGTSNPLLLVLVAIALYATCARAEAASELAPGAGAVHVQEGQALLLTASGEVELLPTRLPAGVFYTLPGHQRLTAAFSQLQADKLAAQARADALEQALALRTAPPTSRVGTGAVVAVAVVLLLAGGVAGYALSR